MKPLFIAISLILAAVLPLAAQTPTQPAPVRYVERELRVPVRPNFPNAPLGLPSLDVLEVYADRPGRHPLALLTHGTAVAAEERLRVTPWQQLNQALWFARRGFFVLVVVRQGYGRSTGVQDSRLGSCGNDRFEEAGDASASDLREAARYAQTLPEVDPDTIISVGVSTGGFAQAALVADPPKGLKAAISFAGGRGSDGNNHVCNVSALSGAFKSFGKQARKHGQTPMLWIYSENDHFFPPEIARQFEAAYLQGGGNEQFILAPPEGKDGHRLYANPIAWSAIIESFLSAHDLLPLGTELLPPPTAPPTPPPTGLSSAGADAWNRYLLAAPYKAFASDGRGAWGIAQAAFDGQTADYAARERCRQASTQPDGCAIVARTQAPK
jgi:dienelactone hydrolase